MNAPELNHNHRILVIDDNEAVRADFRKILCRHSGPIETSDGMGTKLFGSGDASPHRLDFELDEAECGQDGLELVRRALASGRPYAVAFVDLRMPVGWHGIETVERIWAEAPDLQTVLCTAYSDYSWTDITRRLGCSDRLLILKKPFDNIEVLQLAVALTEKWRLVQQTRTSLLTEIAGRKGAEEQALQWKRRYDLISSSSGQALYDLDPVTGAVEWAGAVERVLGRPAAELTKGPTRWAEFLHPDDREIVARQLGDAAGHGLACDLTYRFLDRDGNYRWIHDRSFTLAPPDPLAPRRLGIVEDITARRGAEHRMREQAALLDKTSDAIMVCDLQQRLLYWNRGAERLYGWRDSEVLGQAPAGLLHGSKRPSAAYQQAEETTFQTGGWIGELRQVRKNGEAIIVESRWTLVRNEVDAPTALLMISTDVTERRQLEARFLRAQRLDGIGALASGIAHDLNNVFTPILMAGQLACDLIRNPQADALMEIVLTSAKRGAGMVRQVLTFARGADGERIDLHVESLLREIEALVRDTFPRSIEFKTDFDAQLHHVLGNATQLHQVLMNLCVNARDAMPDGGTLSLTADNVVLDEARARSQPGAHPGPYVHIRVGDTGEGMTPEVMDRIFEPFFTTKEAGRGTGLGLSTSLGIVKSHDGFIDVESAPGLGTQVHVYLPAHLNHFVPASHAAPSRSAAGRGERILVVEDEPAVRDVTRQTLEANGYVVQTAGDGAEGVSLFAASPEAFDLVIVDMMMPLMDGPAMMRAIKRLNPRIRLIAVSGLTGNKSYDRIAASGTVTFLLKPYTVARLLEAVRSVLDADGGRELSAEKLPVQSKSCEVTTAD